MSFLSSSSVFVFCFLSYIQENKKSRIIYIYCIVSGLKKIPNWDVNTLTEHYKKCINVNVRKKDKR